MKSKLPLSVLALQASLIFNLQPSEALAAPTVTAVAAGYYHTLFIESDGSLWAMGRNDHGQLGDGTTTERHLPVMVVAGNVVAVAAGAYHSLFLTSDGNLWAMGYNANGELGDGTANDQLRPEQITFNQGVTAIAAGDYHSLFLKTNTLWGMGVAGSLGNGACSDDRAPVVLQSSNVSVIAGGNFTSFYIDINGSVWATGPNYNGQLGDGTTTARGYFIETLSNHSVFTGGYRVAAGSTHGFYSYVSPGFVVSLWGWGDNYNGDLGDGTTTERDSPVEVMASGVSAMAAGGYHSLVISNSALWAMGDNANGDLGDGTLTERHVPTQIVSGNVTAVAAGLYHSLFIESDGSLWAMGANGNGQLGDGSVNDSHVPERIIPPPQLLISHINLTGTNLVLNGQNDFSSGSAVVLSTTNVAKPLNQWTPIWTNGLGNGAFSLTATNVVNRSFPQQFYILQLFQIY
ncbi:MAG TPA: RCC1 repeat- and reductase domain-containing protein [Verrucomicrobiae bacterium]|nr:RCC1 repeat- and reductase domain-containing protein [Verrucomicrobiae bacterium]